jgi:hypothetical protein
VPAYKPRKSTTRPSQTTSSILPSRPMRGLLYVGTNSHGSVTRSVLRLPRDRQRLRISLIVATAMLRRVREQVCVLCKVSSQFAKMLQKTMNLSKKRRPGQTSPLNVRRIGGVTMAENHVSTRPPIARKSRRYRIDESLVLRFLCHANSTHVLQTLWRGLRRRG